MWLNHTDRQIPWCPSNPCHGYGLGRGYKVSTRACRRPWYQPIQVRKPVTFPTYSIHIQSYIYRKTYSPLKVAELKRMQNSSLSPLNSFFEHPRDISLEWLFYCTSLHTFQSLIYWFYVDEAHSFYTAGFALYGLPAFRPPWGKFPKLKASLWLSIPWNFFSATDSLQNRNRAFLALAFCSAALLPGQG